MAPTKTLSRRHLLRCGLGGLGTVVALPLLEAMGGTGAAHAQTPQSPPLRFLGYYVPNGTIQFGDVTWFPSTTGATKRSFSLAQCSLSALERHKARLSLFKGFRNASSFSGSGNAHMRGITGFLSGAALPKDSLPTHRVTLDQVLANHYAKHSPTRVHSLQLSANNELDKPLNSTYNNLFKNALSMDATGKILPNTCNLKGVFDRLFAGADPDTSQVDAERRRVLRKSVLDHVLADRDRLVATLGADDRRRMDAYFENLRNVERSLETPLQSGACALPTNDFPQHDDALRIDAIGNHVRRTADLLCLAFQCDATRVVTYMLGGEAAGCRYTDIGLADHFHNSLTHHSGNATTVNKHRKVDAYHASLFGELLDRLIATPELDGNLLDRTVILFGSGLGDGNSHSLNNLPLLVAGGPSDRIRHGAFHMDGNGRSHGLLLMSLLQVLGVPVTSFGDNQSGASLDLLA